MHVMEIFAEQGFADFVLAAGYKAEALRDFAKSLPSDWRVDVVDTGEETETGERVFRCRDLLEESFFLTYADGVGNVDLSALRSFHDAHEGCATVTIVPLPSQYGTVDADADGHVVRFLEKPRLLDHWINAGFFVADKHIFDDWPGDDLEQDVLPALAERGELRAFRHKGFWQSLDTYKDSRALTSLSDEAERSGGRAPWFDLPMRASS
jgi:glucose-1-phosphate cytidylyltransferase